MAIRCLLDIGYRRLPASPWWFRSSFLLCGIPARVPYARVLVWEGWQTHAALLSLITGHKHTYIARLILKGPSPFLSVIFLVLVFPLKYLKYLKINFMKV